MRPSHSDHSPAIAEHAVSDSPQLTLASASPRRHELLSLLGIPFTIRVTDAEEETTPAPADVIAALPAFPLALAEHPTLRAWRKAAAIWSHQPTSVVLGADTIVVLDDGVLGKPRDAEHARTMLAQLSGRTHTVYTGLCVFASHDAASAHLASPHFDLVTSAVTLAPLPADEITNYVQTGEPMDKAGAYGIQGLGGTLVRQVVGSYTAVVGLPLLNTWNLLTAVGIAGLHDPTTAYTNWLHHQGKEPLPCPPTQP